MLVLVMAGVTCFSASLICLPWQRERDPAHPVTCPWWRRVSGLSLAECPHTSVPVTVAPTWVSLLQLTLALLLNCNPPSQEAPTINNWYYGRSPQQDYMNNSQTTAIKPLLPMCVRIPCMCACTALAHIRGRLCFFLTSSLGFSVCVSPISLLQGWGCLWIRSLTTKTTASFRGLLLLVC